MRTGNGRYLSVLACCCLMAASAVGVYTNSVGVFYTRVSEALGVGRGAFALHATLCALTAGFLSPLAARLMKKLPLRPLLIAGNLLAALATAGMAGAANVGTFYALGILRGAGMMTFSLLTVTTLINNWFRARHGLAAGIALSFSGLAGAVFSPLFSAFIDRFGWRASFLWFAAIGFALNVPGMLLLRYRPAELGMEPYGGAGASAAQTARGGRIAGAAMALLALMTLLHTSVTGLAQHFPGMAEWLGESAAVGAAMVSAGMIGNIASKLVIGTLSDRVGPFKASMCMIAVNALSLLGLLLFGRGGAWLLYAIAFLYGAVYSVGAVGIPLLTRRIFGAENYASAYSIITIFTSVGSASALTIIGLVYDLTGGYALALTAGLSIDVINLGILTVLQLRQRRAG